MQAKRGGFASESAGAPSEGILDGLPRVFPEIEIVDRELAIGEGRTADLAAIDASGRLVLVLAVESEGDEPVLAALDALAFARRNRLVLAGHFRTTRLRAGLDPLVVLVAPVFSDPLLARLSGLDQELVRCFELRAVASLRGEASYLVPVSPGSAVASPAAPGDARAFFQALSTESRALAERLVRRVGRSDDELVCAAVDRSVSWRLAGELVCCLVAVEGSVQGQVPPHGKARAIESDSDLESFLEEVMARTVGLLGTEASEPPAPEWGQRASPGLLTREEIEAFQQP